MSLPTSSRPLVAGVVSNAQTWRALMLEPPVCDVVELRVDALPKDERLLPLERPCPKPLLLTLRHESEGGAYAWEEAERLTLAERLLPAAAMLDWEIAFLPGAEALLRAAHAHDVAVVASAHFFHSTPSLEEMLELEARARLAGADVVKIAFTPSSEEDLDTGSAFLKASSLPAAVMGMGPHYGPISRRRYAEEGSLLLYGYLGGVPSAPGQLSAAECCELTAALRR